MVANVKPLLWHCFRKIAQMLKSSYWKHDSHIFEMFPSSLIDPLIVHVTEMSKTEPLKCSDLQPLIASGRVSEFHLNGIPEILKTSPHTTAEILRHLSSACKYLTEISISVDASKRQEYSIVMPDLKNLLSEAQNIEYVHSSIEFDLHQLRDSPKLRILNIDFPLENELYRLFLVDDELRVNNSLLSLYISHFEYHPAVSQMAIILKYCSRLIYVNGNIAKALEWLHGEEWKNGTLTHQYNIRFCKLGWVAEAASEIAVRIASETCPGIEKIILHVGSDNAITPISNLRNIKSLHLHWNLDSEGDYITGMQPLLENKKFGQNLTELFLQRCFNTDISSISACCPNLQELSVMCCSSKRNCSDILPIRFPKLNCLIFEDFNIGTKQLIQLLCSAHDLRTIEFRSDISFIDHILEKVLIQNSLSKLEILEMYGCQLSLNSLRMLATTARSLAYFTIWHSERPDEIRAAFGELNPEVEVDILFESI